MYPQAVLLGIGFFRNDRNIVNYTIPLSIIGACISIWHYITQILSLSAVCGLDPAESCANVIVLAYGYISIPMMALTAFVGIILFSALATKKK